MTAVNIYPILSPAELHELIGNERLRILDATIPKVGGILPSEDIRGLRIQDAKFFDLKNVFVDPSNPLPNTMPDIELFNKGCRELGIKNDSIIVIYDQHGVYSSPRAWWMFRYMGHAEVFILNGGLPEWIKDGYPVEEMNQVIPKSSDYHANMEVEMICDKLFVDKIRKDENYLILDARSTGRFSGIDPEPRKDLRSGHIPNSKNLPYNTIIREGKYLHRDNLKEVYDNINPKGKSLVFTCGSGITACVIGLGAVAAGHGVGSVFDGSWSDWGQPSAFPVEKVEGIT